MKNGYYLPVKKAQICRFVGLAFMLVALLWALMSLAEAIVPGWSFSCGDGRGCHQTLNPILLLPEAEQPAVSDAAAAKARFVAYVAEPPVSAGLAGLILAQEGLRVFLFMAVGLTLRRLGKRGEPVLPHALPWLKRAAFAAILWAVAEPLTESLRAMLLLPGTPGGAAWYIYLNLTSTGPALLLAIAAYAVAWALEAGVRAERDLAEFV